MTDTVDDKKFISPEEMRKLRDEGKMNWKPKRRKYASYQNHLNRKGK